LDCVGLTASWQPDKVFTNMHSIEEFFPLRLRREHPILAPFVKSKSGVWRGSSLCSESSVVQVRVVCRSGVLSIPLSWSTPQAVRVASLS